VRQEVQLPNPIPISVINGVDNADAIEGDRPKGTESGTATGAAPKSSSGDTARSRGTSRPDTARSSRTTRPDTARSGRRSRDTARSASKDTTPR
jgi:hypothetical protein